MKLYYGEEQPDADDLEGLLGECIAHDIVSPGCRLGGTVVYREHTEGRDPCQSVCPHEKRSGVGGCGGRPPLPRAATTAKDSVRQFAREAILARELFLAEQVKTLQGLMVDPENKAKIHFKDAFLQLDRPRISSAEVSGKDVSGHEAGRETSKGRSDRTRKLS